VGNELLRSEIAEAQLFPLPLDVLVADCQGVMGYLLQQALANLMAEHGIERSVLTIVTQVVVAEDDPAFASPSKPVGGFLSEEQAGEEKRRGWDVVEDAGRGWRRAVSSPQPLEVVELECIRAMYESGAIVLAAGGGGIPVVRKGPRLEVIIDKDNVTALLAGELKPVRLVMLTAVDELHIGHGTPDERSLREVDAAELQEHYRAGEFSRGSMGPKVACVVAYLEGASGADGRSALITSPEALGDALAGRGGTKVRP
jgi:carbamate kinase